MMDPAGTARSRYGMGAIALHWLIAVLIALNFAAVWVGEGQPQAARMQIMANHKAFGLTILALSLLRILWRLTHSPPPLAESLKAWEAAIAKVVHSLLYFLMIAIPLAGWALVSAVTGRPVSVFGMFDVPPLPLARDKATTGTFHEVHETLALLMVILLVLHIGAALKHQFVDRDATLSRMIPFLRKH